MSEFFEAPQAAAVLKHGILGRYLPVFATKTGSRAGQVVYLDGYAGPGLYDDGSEGSPALALHTAEAVANYRGRATLHGHLIEQDRGSVERLRRLLSEFGATWDVHEGRAEDLLPGILGSLPADVPLFAFVDPFGLPIPFSQTASILQRGGRRTGHGRVGGAATELLLNFSIPGINRVGGQLTGKGTTTQWLKARDTQVAHMDEVLGGAWWQPIWRSEDDDRVDQIRQGYRQRLLDTAGGWAVFDIDVADRWKGPPSYHLLLFTQHPDGVWAFTECLSSASEEYRTYCHEHEGLLDLEPLAEREVLWVSTIEENVREILAEGKPFKPVDRLIDVYGSSFGEARQKHLRKALKQLHKEGVTSTNCVGVNDLGGLLIRPA
jgi:three-Cys-motif partner protein